MVKEYKVDKKSKKKFLFRTLFESIFYYVIILGGFIYFKGINDLRVIELMISGLAVVWVVLFILPLLLIYFNHLIKSKSICFKFDTTSEIYTMKNNEVSIDFTVSDIKEVLLFLSSSSYEKWVDWLTFGKYNYCIIKFKNGESITISCLVCDEIESIIPKKIINRKKKYFPIID